MRCAMQYIAYIADLEGLFNTTHNSRSSSGCCDVPYSIIVRAS